VLDTGQAAVRAFARESIHGVPNSEQRCVNPVPHMRRTAALRRPAPPNFRTDGS
jgi:hypothetical protein